MNLHDQMTMRFLKPRLNLGMSHFMTPFITAEKSAVSTTTKLWSEIFGQPN